MHHQYIVHVFSYFCMQSGDVSSVGSERMLHTHEVGSSNLPHPTLIINKLYYTLIYYSQSGKGLGKGRRHKLPKLLIIPHLHTEYFPPYYITWYDTFEIYFAGFDEESKSEVMKKITDL